jgi:phosphoribosylformimino-5-aminoimidazole carboxamide ribotide isomerase
MQIWPAIDLRGGKCVRLVQGDYDRETIFGDDPAEMAQRWVKAGARRLHLVDLDGARDGRPINLPAIVRIQQTVDVPCQLGGGLRDTETVERMLVIGVSRLVIGTAALKDPDWFRDMVRQHPGRLVLGIDARDGRAATDGWRETSALSAEQLAAQFADEPLAGVVYTDIGADGMLAGPNLTAMARMKSATPHPVIASGGVATLDDIRKLAEIPMSGCIVGRALYEEKFALEDALVAAGETAPKPRAPSSN